MKLNVALIILLITHAIAENDEAKDVGESEVKSAQKEDDAENKEAGDDLSRKSELESYTVPVEVVNDAVTESELVKTAEPEEQKEDSRVERSTASGIEEPSVMKPENDKLITESEHITNRRSSDETTKAASDDEELAKSAASDDAQERAATTESEAENDDVLKKGEEAEQTDEPQVRSADDSNADADAQEKSAVETESTLNDEVTGLGRAAEVDDELLAEGVEGLTANLNTRRMLSPIIDTILDAKARLGETVGTVVDDGILKSAVGDAFEAAEGLKSFDSFRPPPSQTLLPPLMPLPNKQNFFLTPALPIATSRSFELPTQAPIRPLDMNFLHSSEHKPFNGFNSNPFQHPRTFQPFPVSTLRPLNPLLPFGNLPSFEEMFRKAEDSNSQETLNYQNNGYNRRMQVRYGAVPGYLRYKLH